MGFPTLGLSQKLLQKRHSTGYKLWPRWDLNTGAFVSVEFLKLRVDLSCCCCLMVSFWHFVALHTRENFVIMLWPPGTDTNLSSANALPASCRFVLGNGLWYQHLWLVQWLQQNMNNADAGEVVSFWPFVIKLCKNSSMVAYCPLTFQNSIVDHLKKWGSGILL